MCKSGVKPPQSKRRALMRSQALTTALFVCLIVSNAYAQRSQPKSERRNVSIEVFQILGLPLNVHEAVLVVKDSGYVLRCRIANESSGEIVGLRYVLASIDAVSGIQLITNRTEGIKLPAYGTKELTFASPIKYKAKDGSRVVLMLEQVLSAEAIWEVIKGKDTLEAYVKGDYSIQPNVMRVTNQVDAPSPARVIRY
jgi:hypothetical protein